MIFSTGRLLTNEIELAHWWIPNTDMNVFNTSDFGTLFWNNGLNFSVLAGLAEIIQWIWQTLANKWS